MRKEELAKEVATWFENELMKNSEFAIKGIEDPEELEVKDFERRAAIVSFSIEIGRKVLKELKEGTLISLKYGEEENNAIKEIAERTWVEKEWLPEACVVVGEGSGMSVYR